MPYIYSHEELRRLLRAIDTIHRPYYCVEPVTMRTIFLLLYRAGLGQQEALNLERADVDWKGSVLTIRHTKFLKTRLVPVGLQLGRVLAAYARTQPQEDGGAILYNTENRCSRIDPQVIQKYFRFVCKRAKVFRGPIVRAFNLGYTNCDTRSPSIASHLLVSARRRCTEAAPTTVHLPRTCLHRAHAGLSHHDPHVAERGGRRFGQYAKQEGHHE